MKRKCYYCASAFHERYMFTVMARRGVHYYCKNARACIKRLIKLYKERDNG